MFKYFFKVVCLRIFHHNLEPRYVVIRYRSNTATSWNLSPFFYFFDPKAQFLIASLPRNSLRGTSAENSRSQLADFRHRRETCIAKDRYRSAPKDNRERSCREMLRSRHLREKNNKGRLSINVSFGCFMTGVWGVEIIGEMQKKLWGDEYREVYFIERFKLNYEKKIEFWRDLFSRK